MENNTFHPDEMDRLLRETFLETETPENITDMMAKQVYTTNWSAVPPSSSIQKLLGKKLLFKSIFLNSLLAIGIISAVGVSIYYANEYLNTDKIVSQQEPTKTFTVAPIADTVLSEVPEAIPVIENIQTPPAVKKEKQKMKALEATKDSVKAPQGPEPSTATKKTGTILPKPKPRRYVMIPAISPQEAANNEKRKQEMIKQAVKWDKKEWAYIPMSSSTIHGQKMSIQSFYMQTHEISNLQYRTFLYDLVINERFIEYEKAAVYDSAWITKSHLEMFVKEYFWNPAYDNYPVVNISLHGAQAYAIWLTELVNTYNQNNGLSFMNDFRLPTEEEWILAAKAEHDTARYAWQGIYLRNSKGLFLANFQSSREMNEFDGTDVTSPVISYFSNDYGLYNMCGNVAEMTRPNPDGSLVVKGGAWNKPAAYMQVEHTYTLSQNDLPTTHVGFRLVSTYLRTGK